MIYYCEKCNKYYTEDDLIEEQGCYEDDYGVEAVGGGHSYDYLACPNHHTEEDDLEEIGEDDEVVVGVLNYYLGKIEKLEKQVKKLKEQLNDNNKR